MQNKQNKSKNKTKKKKQKQTNTKLFCFLPPRTSHLFYGTKDDHYTF